MGARRMGIVLSAFFASFVVLWGPAGSQDAAPERDPMQDRPAPRYASNRIVVKFKKGTSPRAQQAHHIAKGIEKSRKLSAGPGRGNAAGRERDIDRIDIVTVPDGGDIDAMVRTYRALPDVEYAEPDYITSVDSFIMTTTPNDPRFSEQWALTKIQAPQAWDATTGSPSVVVAVIDTGIDEAHPDLAANLWANPGEIAGNGIDDDGNGYIDDVRGWDWVNNDNNPTDDNGHGTHKAGIAAAVGNNGVGVSGVAWNCKVMALKTSDASGNGSSINHAAAIVYAADMGARISNNSYNAPGTSQALTDAVRYADSAGHLTVTIAGNQSADVSSYTPSNVPEAVTVAGTTSGDLKMGMSNYGALVDVSAPGTDILSTARNNTYALASGTSDAAPHAVGILALLASQNPNRTNAQLIETLKYSCDDIDALNTGYEGKLGNGRINAFNAVNGILKPKPETVAVAIGDGSGNGNGYPDRGETTAMTVTLRNVGANAVGLSGTLTTTDAYTTIYGAGGDFGSIPNGQTGSNLNSPFSFAVSSGAPADHIVTFTLNLTGNGGSYAGTLKIKVNVGPNIAYVVQTFNDAGAGGSAPGAAEPGETVDMIVTLKNSWGAATNVAGTLTSTSPYVTISDGTGGWGTIGNNAEGANTAAPFRLTISAGTPTGSVIPFAIALSADWNYTKTISFNYLVGWSMDKNTNVPVCVATGNQQIPAAATDGAGGMIVTWIDYRNGNADVYAQRIDANGYPRWTHNGVPICTAAGDQYFVYYGTKIVADGSGGAVIAWTDSRNGVYSEDIYAQRIDGNGNVLWQLDGANVCTASGSRSEPSLAGDGAGGVIVAWTDYRNESSNEIYLQRVGADGSMQWTNDGTLIGAGSAPRIVGDGVGGAIVGWVTVNNTLYVQRINATGAAQWTSGGVVLGMAPAGYTLMPNMLGDGAGGSFVAWSYKTTAHNGTDSAYVQKINASGQIQWAAGGVTVASQINVDSYEVQMTSDGAGGTIVVWDRYTPGNTDVYAQRVSAAGTIQWTSGGVAVSNFAYGQSSSRAVADGAGGVIVTWQDYRFGSGLWQDIYAMRITSSGTASPGWTTNGVSVSTGLFHQIWPIIVGDNAGGAIIAWTDYRNASYGTIANADIYAQRISSVGVAGRQSSKLSNISTRGYVGTGSNNMIGGFIITGNEPMTVLIRSYGPTLADYGLTGVLANPYLNLYSGSTVVARNDNWQTNDPLMLSPVVWKGTATDIQAAGYAPSGTNNAYESALLVKLPPGAYTAILSGVNNGTGTGLIGVFTLPQYPSTSRLTNISTRGFVGTGSNNMIGGFIISGTEPKKVLIRSYGPMLVDYGLTGVLANPYLNLYSGSTVVARNDNWQTSDPLMLSPVIWKGTTTDIQATGKAPSGTNSVYESALLVKLPPGAYTVILSGVNNGTGTGLIGVFEIPE